MSEEKHNIAGMAVMIHEKL